MISCGDWRSVIRYWFWPNLAIVTPSLLTRTWAAPINHRGVQWPPVEPTARIMSRAFVKEDAADGIVYIPPRAPLPEGAVNFVTRRGHRLLKEEMAQLETEREQLKRGDKENRDIMRALTIVRGKIKDLESRIVGAKLVKSASQPQNEVRFGATVTITTVAGGTPGLERKFTLVGVDEADITTMRVGFVAPISRALIGLGVGETTTLMMGGTEETLEVSHIDYMDDLKDG